MLPGRGIIDHLGNVGGMIADPLEVLGDEQQVRRLADIVRIFHHVGEEGPEDAVVEVVDRLVALAHPHGRFGVALDVWRRDGEVDEHYESLFRELLSLMQTSPDSVAAGAHLLFVAKNLERIGDHATNIAEILHFQMTGEELVGERPKVSLPDVEPEGRA